MAKKGIREKILLKCEESGMINYTSTKNKKLHPERLEIKKYCPKLRKHTVHKEVKK